MAVKPPYRVPSMVEVERVPLNGYRLVSLFSGAGGSCLGFRMAGFKTTYASEFVEHARETYALNHPRIFIDDRDIRQVHPSEVKVHYMNETGTPNVDVLEGSPPCSDFSMSGKRQEGWGEEKKYSDTEQRVDDLFFEFVRILEGLQPRVFVAENVPGLIRGVAKGYFLKILKRLKDSGYNVEARVLDAQWLGVPQVRQRLIFIGVRNDLKLDPIFPSPLPYRYSIKDALVGLPEHDIPEEADFERHRPAYLREWKRMKQGEGSEKFFNLIRVDPNKPCPTVVAAVTRAAAVCHWHEGRFFTIPELKRICGFPDDFKLIGRYDKQGERLGRAVPPLMMRAVAREVKKVLDRVG